MKITFLGTGTSQGMPVVACNCNVCLSVNSRDKRLRSSVLVEIENNTFAIDAGPDFRTQMLRENVEKLDAIILTHEHFDHIGGLDDVRSFNWVMKKPMDIYAENIVFNALKNVYHYIFNNSDYPGIPKLNLITIENKPFKVNNIDFIPIRGIHYKLPVLGYRIKDFTYITDLNKISDEEIDKIKGSKVFVISALRKTKHVSHFNLEEALEVIEKVKPESAYITHISHLMGFHDEVGKELPENVFFAYDGLKIEI